MKTSQNLSKKLICILVAVIVTFIFAVMVISLTTADIVAKAEEEENLVAQLFVTSTDVDTFGNLYTTDSTGKMYIKFTLSKRLNNGVTINYHAEDRSAVSSFGDYYLNTGNTGTTDQKKADYTHNVNTLIIPAGSTIGQIDFYVAENFVDAKSYTETTNSYGNVVSGYQSNISRFALVIDSIQGGAYINVVVNNISSQKTEDIEYSCLLRSKYEMALVDNGSTGYKILEPYSKQWEHSVDYDIEDGDGGDEYEHHSLDFTGEMNNSLGGKYSSDYIYSVFHEIGTVLAICGQANMQCSISNWADLDFYYKLNKYGDGGTKYEIIKGWWDWFMDQTHNLDRMGSDASSDFDKDGQKWCIAPSTADHRGEVVVRNESRSYDRNGWFKTKARYYDITAATITGYSLDYSSIVSDNVLRLCVRFSEPVQVNNKPDVCAKITTYNSETKETTDTNNQILFNYVGGNYTNTLYFEASLSSSGLSDTNVRISKLTIMYFSGLKRIADLGYSKSGSNNQCADVNYESNPIYMICDLDLRTPKMSIETTSPYQVQPTRTVKVNVSNMSTGILYYKWSSVNKATKNITDYSASITISEGAKDLRSYELVGSGLNGEYYLHLLLITKWYRIVCYTCGQGGATTGKGTGGYFFDNITPTITSPSLLSDSMTDKLFALSLDESGADYVSGMDSLYISVATRSDYIDAMDTVVWTNGTTVDSSGFRSSVYQLSFDTPFMYATFDKDIGGIVRYAEPYGGSSEVNVWNNNNEVKKYVKEKEIQSFEVVTLTDDLVTALKKNNNKGEGNYISGTTDITPVKGQVWIKYKRSSWLNTGKYNNLYAYYYYSEGNKVINEANFCEQLNDALDKMVTLCVSQGTYPTFSSQQLALEYVTKKEYEDLELVVLSKDQEGWLKSGSKNMTMAQSETTVPQAGQAWIKYKVKNWNYSLSGNSGWVYYYYGNGSSTIDVNNLSANLTSAIGSVASYIVSKGTTISLYNTGFLYNGLPYMPSTKSFYKGYSATQSKTGSPYTQSVIFKDSDIKLSNTGGDCTVLVSTSQRKYHTFEEDKYQTVYIGFYCKDKAGNSTQSAMVYKPYKFDTREHIQVIETITQGGMTANSVVESINVFDITEGEDLTFNYECILTEDEQNDIARGAITGQVHINELYYGDTLLKNTEYSNYFIISTIAYGSKTVTLQPTETGYFSISLLFQFTSTTTGDYTQKVSDTFFYYITDGQKEETANYKHSQEDLMLINTVFQLGDLGANFYYMTPERLIRSEPYSIDTTLPSCFSSEDMAKSYVKFKEYQDFYLVVLDEYIATALNEVASIDKNYIRASGEDHVARIGSTWIRYKRSIWTSASPETDWVFYWYSDSTCDSIDVSRLTDTLKKAMDKVVETIVSYGTEIYLVGEDGRLDKNGSPYLAMSQRHAIKETATASKSGTNLSNYAPFAGDVDLYSNLIKDPLVGEIPLATNMALTITPHTLIYYSFYDGIVPREELQMTRLEVEDGTLLKTAMGEVSTGVYLIRELDNNGMREYFVYMDKTAPTIGISFITAVEGISSNMNISSANNGSTYSAKSFSITGFSGVEYDKLAYISVYLKSGALDHVYYPDSLNGNYINLSAGTYTIIIGDRSGNIYKIKVLICDEDMDLNVRIVDNAYVAVTCNRDMDEIRTYSVYCDDFENPIDSEYTGETKRYTKAGYYMIIVEDIYGFTKKIAGESGLGLQFARSLPTVKWSYEESNGNYANYVEGQTACVKFSETLGARFYISTSRKLRFYMSDEYQFKFTEIDDEKNVNYNPVSHLVIINSTQRWVVEISYVQYPEVVVTYECTMDIDPPIISASYKQDRFSYDEMEDLISGGASAKVGDIFIPDTIGYYKTRESSSYISHTDYVNSNLIKLDVTDVSGVGKVEIILDDKVLATYEPENNVFPAISLSRYGRYKIIAYDTFNNKAVLEFYNIASETVTYRVDDTNKAVHTKDTYYGNQMVDFTIMEEGKLFIKSKVGDTSYFFYYTIEKGEIIVTQYKCINVEIGEGIFGNIFDIDYVMQQHVDTITGEITTRKKILFSKTDIAYKVNKWYKVLTSVDEDNYVVDGIDMEVKYDANGYFYFHLPIVGSYQIIETRIDTGNNREPYYNKTILSKELSDITLKTNKGITIPQGPNGSSVRTNTDFYIVSTSIDSTIVKIEMAYSELKNFDKSTVVYDCANPDDLLYIDTSKNGFYMMKVTNIFGNVKTYVVNRSDVFQVIGIATYDDVSMESRFSVKYQGVIKSNNYITFEAYSDIVTFRLIHNGVSKDVSSTYVEGMYSVTFYDEGVYELTVTDNFGNKVVRNFEIKKTNIQFDMGMLSGYNERALRKSEGYTSNTLSIVEHYINDLNIAYISYIYNDSEKVLYNALTENIVEYSASSLQNAIGKDGDGIYTVILRDNYGSIAKTLIHYAGKSPLSIERKIRSSKTGTLWDVADAEANGIWSNGSITFSTTAEVYQFIVDTEKLVCPKVFEFASLSDQGKFEYATYYIDEYGYEHNITVHLVRQTLTVKETDKVNIQVLDDVANTRNNIVMTYSKDATCTYTLNNEEAIVYEGDEVLYKDGTYRFTVSDRAGNVATRTIKKDTTCEFSFEETQRGKFLLNGDVANTKKVVFSAVNRDSVQLKKVYLDGVVRDDLLGSSTFSTPGKWSIILTDALGNEAFFEFYIVTHALEAFAYTTPSNYVVTEMWYNAGDGSQVNYMEFVEQHNSYSSFSATENGTYSVVMTSTVYNNAVNFAFEIDDTPPAISLEGCQSGDTTIENIKLKGYSQGDIIYIYKDGKLDSTLEVTSDTMTFPEITEGGKYKIIVTNQAGVSAEVSFNRTHVTNTAGSILIIVLCLAVVIGILVGMIIRNRVKVDD